MNEIRKVLTQQLTACRGTVNTRRRANARFACLLLPFARHASFSTAAPVAEASQQKGSDSVFPSPTSNSSSVSLRWAPRLVDTHKMPFYFICTSPSSQSLSWQWSEKPEEARGEEGGDQLGVRLFFVPETQR